ncbi:Hypothetical predicted protein [Lecanosticta acicola]|uniref:Calcineurin-like phosphoesterase domain-containing protein n=1 Tax=Lecanosticta acicola TaxID=111012 RepID=A0AAI9EAV5_9PEZI|nr:Hypothetical predicted protein [Lecanosticta acicola]
MRLSVFLLRIFQILLPLAILATTYLYLYPVFQGCAFPEAKGAETAVSRGEQAPFRLLALADPQLEGDTSIHDARWGSLERIQRTLEGNLDFEQLCRDVQSLFQEDVPQAFRSYRKRLDLWGNDLYLAHVFRSVKWWTDPTHVVVLGDLLGSQWIGDEEFWRRTERFWDVVYRGGSKVEESIMDADTTEVLGADKRWRERIVAVAGNHDVGYAGDLDDHRVKRFEEAFGRVNWEVRFRLDEAKANQNANLDYVAFETPTPTPELRLTVLNSMNLDEPAKHAELRQASLDFLDRKLHQERLTEDTGTVLLTHIPLFKESGICVDGPFFDHFEGHHGGGIKEQNHLSHDVSTSILNGVVGPERRHKAIILNGHDHEGCQTYHSRANKTLGISEQDEHTSQEHWQVQNYYSPEPHTGGFGVREITVRSTMGEFGGNAGLLSAWWDNDTREWKFDYESCICGVQHIWWAVHVLDIVEIALGIGALMAFLSEDISRPRAGRVTITKKTA